MESKKIGINGAFVILQIMGKYLFLRRTDNSLWDLTGGGFEITEIDYKNVLLREIVEEIYVKLPPESLHLCAILGQRLPKQVSEQYGGVENGYVFLHYAMLYTMPEIKLDGEHNQWKLFSYDEIIENYKDFSSGPLWQFFTFLSFQETNKLQEGMLRDRRIWQGKEYTTP
jgi:8-oxo-dGTP pyrophosphatase MutT (NUDIX family)